MLDPGGPMYFQFDAGSGWLSANSTPSPETMRKLAPCSTGSPTVPFDGGFFTGIVPRSATFRRAVEKLMRRASLWAAITTSCVQPVIGAQASIELPLQIGGGPA